MALDFPILVETCSREDCNEENGILFMLWTRETGPVLLCPQHRTEFIADVRLFLLDM